MLQKLPSNVEKETNGGAKREREVSKSQEDVQQFAVKNTSTSLFNSTQPI